MADGSAEGLGPAKRVEFRDILMSVYTRSQFAMLLNFNLNRKLNDFASESDADPAAFDKVIEAADKGRWWGELLQQAKYQHSTNEQLLNFAQSAGGTGRLSEKQLKQLSTLLNDVYTRQNFKDFLAMRLNRSLNDYAGPADPDPVAIEKVLRAANTDNEPWWSQILNEARYTKPNDPFLIDFEQQLGQGLQIVAGHREGDVVSAPQKCSQLPAGDVRIWLTHLGEIESRVCRIECPDGVARGTGFLIAPNIVMTNYHVVSDAIHDEIKRSAYKVRFDYKAAADGTSISPGKTYALAKDGILDYSPCGASDCKDSASGPNDDELDYALLLVDGSPGNDPVGGNTRDEKLVKRGWINVPAVAYDFLKDRALCIVQYPLSGSMQVAVDASAVSSLNGRENRVRYGTVTSPGSSGSPCFSSSWDLVALHQGNDPNYAGAGLKGNQGIPVSKIISRLGRLGKLHLIADAQVRGWDAVILRSPRSELTATVSFEVEDLKAQFERRSISYTILEDKWAKKSQHGELLELSMSQPGPIFVQPVDNAWAGAYALTDSLLKKDVELSAGGAIKGARYIIWHPEPVEDENFESKLKEPSSTDLWFRQGAAIKIADLIAQILGRIDGGVGEPPPPIGYQEIEYRQLQSAGSNIIREVIIPQISAPLLNRYTPPEWDAVPFSGEEEAKRVIEDLANYQFGIVAINNLNGEIDQDGEIPDDFRERILTFDRLLTDKGVNPNSILRLGIIATTRPERHLFKYFSIGANKVVSRWRFVAVGVEGNGTLRVDNNHLGSLCAELQARLNAVGGAPPG